MRRFLRDNGLGLGFGALFVGALVGQAFAGHADFNNRQIADGGDPVSMLSYVTSSDFAVDVAENWQSEYLQFFLFIFATIWLIQRGSPESKEPNEVGWESDEQQQLGQRGIRGRIVEARLDGGKDPPAGISLQRLDVEVVISLARTPDGGLLFP